MCKENLLFVINFRFVKELFQPPFPSFKTIPIGKQQRDDYAKNKKTNH